MESLPHTVFLTSKGKTRKTIVGYQPAQILAPILRAGLTDRPAVPTKRKPAKAKATPKKVRPKKAQAKKAQAKKTEGRKSRPKKNRSVARTTEGAAATDLQRLRGEVKRLRAEQRKQSELLQRILRELQKKK